MKLLLSIPSACLFISLIACGGDDGWNPPQEPAKDPTVSVPTPAPLPPYQGGSGEGSAVENDKCMASDCNLRQIPDPRHRDPVDEGMLIKDLTRNKVLPPIDKKIPAHP